MIFSVLAELRALRARFDAGWLAGVRWRVGIRLLRAPLLALAWLLTLPAVLPAADDCLIAVIKARGLPRHESIHQAFLDHLGETGCRIYVQSPNPDYMSFRNSARKAMAIGADLLVTYGTNATLAARIETHDAPILFADVFDPAAHDLVAAGGQPGRYTSGVRGDAPIQTLLKVYLETTGLRQLAVLFDPRDPDGSYQLRSVKDLAADRNLEIIELPLSVKGQLSATLENMPRQGAGLFVTDSTNLLDHLPAVYEFAARHRIAVVSQSPGAAERGSLVSLVTDPAEQGQALAVMVRKAVQGVRPSSMAMVRPKEVALVVNLREAERLGIKVPFEVLASTTRVIR